MLIFGYLIHWSVWLPRIIIHGTWLDERTQIYYKSIIIHLLWWPRAKPLKMVKDWGTHNDCLTVCMLPRWLPLHLEDYTFLTFRSQFCFLFLNWYSFPFAIWIPKKFFYLNRTSTLNRSLVLLLLFNLATGEHQVVSCNHIFCLVLLYTFWCNFFPLFLSLMFEITRNTRREKKKVTKSFFWVINLRQTNNNCKKNRRKIRRE